MPCAKCEKKLAANGKSQLACTDVWRPAGAGGDRNERKVGENKLLSAKARYSPYAPVASGSKAAKSASGGKAALAVTFGKCEKCKSTVSKPGAIMCQCEYDRAKL